MNKFDLKVFVLQLGQWCHDTWGIISGDVFPPPQDEYKSVVVEVGDTIN